MEVGLLYSGGKDSTLAALLLEDFYDVTLVTAQFGISDDWKHARATADATGFAFERLELDAEVAHEAVAMIRDDGFPRNGIQHVHQHALERAAADGFDVVADGTRRDDRVPTVSRAQAQSLEDRHSVDYISPLSGFGRGAVDQLVDAHLEVTVGPSEEIRRADYEAELRALIVDEDGLDAVGDYFPDHEQTYVTDVR
ncbi:alpha hydrolase [Natrarchaeobius halalkaliphilus]|uniref:Alpha hydrolase n=1 Tax=Natrarchaeobius halalkaliphilus TaxID=1679091 RepID=A0A3N6P1Z0_9EURY|nr:asparagine synthase-related protein [Natrarchaeobius halalkaliphilus]RQG89135.1 alpha hydrolase [Natrarchaeobius halalkaliphilus]